jgi:hypothetical protein
VGGIRQAIEMSRAIMGLNRGTGLPMAILALALAAPAGAQENLDSGKTGAQLFASNCAVCHKNARALSKSGGLLGLSSFLREHYTVSSESASIIAAYLESLGNAPTPGKRTGATKPTAKGDEKAKVDEKKGKPKSGETKSVKPDQTGKPPEAKTSGPKISGPKSEPKSEPKTSEPKSGEAKPAEPKANDAKASAPKPPDAKTSEPKPDAAPAAKPDKSEKSD